MNPTPAILAALAVSAALCGLGPAPHAVASADALRSLEQLLQPIGRHALVELPDEPRLA